MAGRRPQIDRGELARLVAEGWSVQQLAERFGVSASGVLQAKRAAGLSKAMLDHSGAIPWRLRAEDRQSGPATNLRTLSTVAQGRTVPREKLNTALRWAQRLVGAGLDVDYRPDTGFCEVPAGAESHIGALVAEVRKVLDEG
ncbi:hypothetical protein SAMN05421505_101109 [Sinosporangium album]|uniref:Homeodomain-like domain-containing protein n=1 Tax=Sinosporangium album TaxID=504805 RepID=A0A1G7QV48_9ACTN|nr:hypothetical protein [Sinosporangium album]SDG01540.1 hypothetical protein SAMN05421505_101109 [Sinosporangium album]